jgi:hypothetical protein
VHYTEIPRHPLGLPPGSVRAILALQVVLTFWLLLLVPEDRKVQIPLYLYFLVALVMIFFVSHGKSIAKKSDPTPSPLYLPGGSVRFLIVAGTAAVLGYLAYLHQTNPDVPNRFDRLNPTMAQLEYWKFYVGALLIGFMLGYAVRVMPFRHGYAYQSFQAWIAILAMFSLTIDMIFQVFINTTLVDKLGIGVVYWQTAVTGIVAFYYGSRS